MKNRLPTHKEINFTAGILSKPKRKKPKPFTGLEALEAFEDVCLRNNISPAEGMIKAYQEAQKCAAESGFTSFDALKLQVEILKPMLNKLYPNKNEQTVKGDKDAPIIHEIRRTIVKPNDPGYPDG